MRGERYAGGDTPWSAWASACPRALTRESLARSIASLARVREVMSWPASRSWVASARTWAASVRKSTRLAAFPSSTRASATACGLVPSKALVSWTRWRSSASLFSRSSKPSYICARVFSTLSLAAGVSARALSIFCAPMSKSSRAVVWRACVGLGWLTVLARKRSSRNACTASAVRASRVAS